MKTLTLQLPDSVDEKDVKMQIAAMLFEKGMISSGQAAKLVGISKLKIKKSNFKVLPLS